MASTPPSEDPKDLDLGSIRISWGKLWINVKENDEIKWIEVDNDFDEQDLSFWKIYQADEEERTEFRDDDVKFEIDGKFQDVSSPIPINISFTADYVKIRLQDYGGIYKTAEYWSTLTAEDKYQPFRTLWKRLLHKISAEIETDYSYYDRLKQEEDSPKVTSAIKEDWRTLVSLMDTIGYLLAKYNIVNPETPKTPETPELPQPKFAIGDKVVYNEKDTPKTITSVNFDKNTNSYFYEYTWDDTQIQDTSFEDQLEKYIEKAPETPEIIIQKGEFFERKSNVWLATEDSVQGRGFQYIVMESYRYFKAEIWGQAGFITFNQTDTAYRKFGELKCGILYDYKKGFGFRCEKGKLEIIEPNINNLGVAEAVAQRIIMFLATFDVELSNEFEAIWKRLEDGVVREMIRADWRNTKADCEADPSKIVSSQVKRFYDLNKNRIEKLKPEFSCKIVQALVSLSNYESCGIPSSESLPKPKNDLLSDIKNFTL